MKEKLGKEINDFNQEEYGEAAGKPGIGFCTAVCIDWARRVLPRGEGTDTLREQLMRASFTRDADRRKFQTVRQLGGQVKLGAMNKENDAIENVKTQLVNIWSENSGKSHCQISNNLQTELRKYLRDFPAKQQYEVGDVLNWVMNLQEKQDETEHRTPAGWGGRRR